MGDPVKPPHRFELTGGRLCLDLVNTRDRARGVERLPGYPELLEFARQAAAVDDARARRLLAEARRRPGEAARVHAEALRLREALHRIFLAQARGEPIPPADVALASEALGRALSRRRIEPGTDGFALGWDPSPEALDAPVWPMALSAAELLTSGGQAARVRVCGLFDTGECGWLFVDETRAGTRRWCSMKDCGNRAKARRHHQRQKEGR